VTRGFAEGRIISQGEREVNDIIGGGVTRREYDTSQKRRRKMTSH